MKQMEVTQKVIGENTFYLKPFPAFVAANISGELTALISPMLGALGGVVGEDADNFDIRNVKVDDAVPAVSKAFNGITGDKVEDLMKKLLVQHKNIAVSGPATGDATKQLDMDLANEVFCGELQDMYALCFEVIKLNYAGFFRKFGDLFGGQKSASPTMDMTASAT